MNYSAEEIAFRAARVRREAKARADAIGRAPDPWFNKREREYLAANPHLAAHKHCGLCPDTEARPVRKVKMPNGHVLHSAWYKVPTTDEDAKRAMREAKWLSSKEGKAYYAPMFRGV